MSTAAPTPRFVWDVHLSIGVLMVFSGIIFTRLPSLAGGAVSAAFFSFTGIGVITGRLLVGGLSQGRVELVALATALNLLGIIVLGDGVSVASGAVGGLAIGLGSGILMQILTERLTLLPPRQHGPQLARYSAAVALGLGLGGFLAGLFPGTGAVSGSLPALVALAVLAGLIAVRPGMQTSRGMDA